MAKKLHHKKQTRTESVSDDGFDPDTADNSGLGYQWLDTLLKDKDRSRIQRQMKARRELERRREEKHLRALIDDEWFVEQLH